MSFAFPTIPAGYTNECPCPACVNYRAAIQQIGEVLAEVGWTEKGLAPAGTNPKCELAEAPNRPPLRIIKGG